MLCNCLPYRCNTFALLWYNCTETYKKLYLQLSDKTTQLDLFFQTEVSYLGYTSEACMLWGSWWNVAGALYESNVSDAGCGDTDCEQISNSYKCSCLNEVRRSRHLCKKRYNWQTSTCTATWPGLAQSADWVDTSTRTTRQSLTDWALVSSEHKPTKQCWSYTAARATA